MTAPVMLPGLAEIANQPVTRTTAGELPPHVKPGRKWRNTRYDKRGTWHLPADRSPSADGLCGAFIVRMGVADDEEWFAEGDEPASACRSCLRIVKARDAAEVVAQKTDDAP